MKLDFLVAQTVKNLPAVQETRVWSLGWEDPLEKVMATHSSILAWRISWTEEPGGLQSLELQELDMTEQLTLSTLNDVEHLFICLVAIYMFSLQKYQYFGINLTTSGRPVHWKLQKELHTTNINWYIMLTDLNTQYCWMGALENWPIDSMHSQWSNRRTFKINWQSDSTFP